MPRANVDDLTKCASDANGNKTAVMKCGERFVSDGGKGVQEGGKVFTDPDGRSIYVTAGGKVFEPKA